MTTTDERYREALALMPDGLYPKALYRIGRNAAVRLSPGGWYAWSVVFRHGHRPPRIDGYAAAEYQPGQTVRLLPVPQS